MILLNLLFIVCLDYTLISLSSSMSFLCWWYPNTSVTRSHIGLLLRILSLSSCSITCVSSVIFTPIHYPCLKSHFISNWKGFKNQVLIHYLTTLPFVKLHFWHGHIIFPLTPLLTNAKFKNPSFQYIQVYL